MYDKLIKSVFANEKNAIEFLSKAYEIVTFRSLSQVEKKEIQNSIEEYGYEKTKLSMLSLWFNSEAYEASYDYSKQKFVGQSWYQFQGFLKDMKNTQIANAKVEIMIRAQHHEP